MASAPRIAAITNVPAAEFSNNFMKGKRRKCDINGRKETVFILRE